MRSNYTQIVQNGIFFFGMFNVDMPSRNWDKKHDVLRKKLREIRVDAGLTQEDLAEALGEAQSYISKYERGERRLGFVDVLTICKACKTDPNMLIKALKI